jgi:Spy/CpxP family protein refolding chaperone
MHWNAQNPSATKPDMETLKMMLRPITIAALVLALSFIPVLPGRSLALAQGKSPMKDDLEQLAVDLHVGVDRSSLTPEQKAQLRDDFRELKRAHQNHEMFAGLRAARSIRRALNSGAFQPADRQRIEADIMAIKEAREDLPQGFGESGGAF